ncbi:MAG: hypothetical protein IPK76_01495 [Lewinellaceae bacterium]|nr:hypothetical protein [Lewinellaceae bacterium]
MVCNGQANRFRPPGVFLEISTCSGTTVSSTLVLACSAVGCLVAFFGIRILGVDLLRIVVATDVGGAVTPTAVGGAPVKLAMLIQQGYSPGKL